MSRIFILFLFTNILLQTAEAQEVLTRRKNHFNLTNGVALQGYDPVAYFTLSKALKGKEDISVVHEGITYHFSSINNRNEFKKSPDKYEPQFGGWCAYAMGESGEKVEVDPGTFKVLDGRLYLFYNAYFNNTLKKWDKDEPNLKRKAVANWSKVYR